MWAINTRSESTLLHQEITHASHFQQQNNSTTEEPELEEILRRHPDALVIYLESPFLAIMRQKMPEPWLWMLFPPGMGYRCFLPKGDRFDLLNHDDFVSQIKSATNTQIIESKNLTLRRCFDVNDFSTETLHFLNAQAMGLLREHSWHSKSVCHQLVHTCFPQADRLNSKALMAGMLLWCDELDQSHEQSQSIEGTILGDAWHALMHRREGDFRNSKYWWRRVGVQPAGNELRACLQAMQTETLTKEAFQLYERLMTGSTWDAGLFVDMCQQHVSKQDSPESFLLRIIQQIEMLLLMKVSLESCQT